MSVIPLSLLDNVRLCNGADGLKNYYRGLMKNDREKALELINDQNLSFGSLYLLKNEFADQAALELLCPLYRKVLKVADGLAVNIGRRTEALLRSDRDDTYSALRWMLKASSGAERIGSSYDRLIEHAAALLVKSFGDTESLNDIAELIFMRNKSGKLIHELVWAFFEARNPESLFLIVPWLNSTDCRDVKLARRLLWFIPCIREKQGNPDGMLYHNVMAWLQENMPFLYYTGESLHLSGQPMHYAIEWSTKYLCCSVSEEKDEFLSSLNPFEAGLQKQFRELPEKTQILLADFSYSLYRSNFNQWHNWLQLPMMNQISLAERFGGRLS